MGPADAPYAEDSGRLRRFFEGIGRARRLVIETAAWRCACPPIEAARALRGPANFRGRKPTLTGRGDCPRKFDGLEDPKTAL